jgi:hypothetical protein
MPGCSPVRNRGPFPYKRYSKHNTRETRRAATCFKPFAKLATSLPGIASIRLNFGVCSWATVRHRLRPLLSGTPLTIRSSHRHLWPLRSNPSRRVDQDSNPTTPRARRKCEPGPHPCLLRPGRGVVVPPRGVRDVVCM